jgi:hypothetical protein
MDLEDDTHPEDKNTVVTIPHDLIDQLANAVYARMLQQGHVAKLVKSEVDEVVDNLPSQVFSSLEDNIEQLLINSGTWDDLMSDATSACEDMLQDVENKVTDNCIQYIRDNISVEIDI